MKRVFSKYRPFHVGLIVSGLIIAIISIVFGIVVDVDSRPQSVHTLDFGREANLTVHLDAGGYEIWHLDKYEDKNDDDFNDEEELVEDNDPGAVLIRDKEGNRIAAIPGDDDFSYGNDREWVKFASFEVDVEGEYELEVANPVEIHITEPFSSDADLVINCIIGLGILMSGTSIAIGISLISRDRDRRKGIEIQSGMRSSDRIIVEKRMWGTFVLCMVILFIGSICIVAGLALGKMIVLILGICAISFGIAGTVISLRHRKVVVDEEGIKYRVGKKMKFSAGWTEITHATLKTDSSYNVGSETSTTTHNLYVGSRDDLLHITHGMTGTENLRKIYGRIVAKSKKFTNISIEPLDDWVLGKRKDWISRSLRKANERDTRERWARVRLPDGEKPVELIGMPRPKGPSLIENPASLQSISQDPCNSCGALVYMNPDGTHECPGCGYRKG